jgi:hypothetical protein
MAKTDLEMLLKEDHSDIIELFEDILEEKNLEISLNFEFQGNKRLNKLLKLIKIPDQYSLAMNKDVLVQFNIDYFDLLDDDEIKKILIEQEIDKIEYNLSKGTWKLGNYAVTTNFGIINKWTYNKVGKAIETEKLLSEQLKEKKKEEKGK